MSLLKFNSWSSINETVAFDPSARYPDPTFGFQAGSVDSGKTVSGGSGGNWGGAMPRALWFASVANDFMSKLNGKPVNVVSSQKRSRRNTRGGSMSDHYENNLDAYAVDLACRGEKGDALLAHLMQLFGHPEYKGGSWLSVTKGGYRYQVGWKVKDHFDHIHVGVKKLGGTTQPAKPTTPVSATTDKIPGNTFGEKLYNNPKFKTWLMKTLPKEYMNITVRDVEMSVARPETKEWFMKNFGLDVNGNPSAAGSPNVPSEIKSSENPMDLNYASKRIKSKYSGKKAKNVDILIEEMEKQGITSKYAQIGILSTIGKESGFVPQNEIGYGKTSNDRIRKIFGARVKGLTDDQLNAIKKDDVKFFDQVYGLPAKAFFKFNTGNDKPGDGYKYRGRGFNGITFKTGYEKYSKTVGMDLVSNPDMLNDINVAAKAAVIFFKNNLKSMGYDVTNPNVFKSKDEAIKASVMANHGGRMPGGVDALGKAKEVSNNFESI